MISNYITAKQARELSDTKNIEILATKAFSRITAAAKDREHSINLYAGFFDSAEMCYALSRLLQDAGYKTSYHVNETPTYSHLLVEW